MAVYFVFSDEAGCYCEDRSDKFVVSHPYYIRASLITSANNWTNIRKEFCKIKSKYNIPLDEEVKWSYLWSIKKDRKDDKLTPQKNYYFLKHLSEEELFSYAKEVMSLIHHMDFCKVIYTITDNDKDTTPKINRVYLYRMHLQDHMQRVEMELQSNQDNLALLFFDPVSKKVNEIIEEAYNEIYLSGDLIKKYKHIKDTLLFEKSHYSYGIQLADFCAGIFNSCLKGYPNATMIYKEIISEYLRCKDSDGQIMGYGIIEVPKKLSVRLNLTQILDANISS